MLKRIIIIVFAYVGIATGAGLASGQEVLQYFVAFGHNGFTGLIIAALLHTLIGGIILSISSHYRARTHNEVIEKITHPIIEKIIDYILIGSCFILGFVMFAGAGSNLNQQFGLPIWVGSLICAVLVATISMLDFEKVSKIIGSFTPLIFIFILIGLVYTIMNSDFNYQLIEESTKDISTTLPNWWISTLNYFGMCVMVCASMFFVLGGDELNPVAAKYGGFIGGALVGLLTFVLGLMLFLQVDIIKFADLPSQIILNNIHPALGIMMSFVIFGMIFNTAIGLFYSLARRFSSDRKGFKKMIFILVPIGFVLSFAGFKQLVGLMYPLLGYAGIFFVGNLVYAWFKDRKNIKKEERIRTGIFKIFWKKHDENHTFTEFDQVILDNLAEESIIEGENISHDLEEFVKDNIE